jgi:hypothetical protein
MSALADFEFSNRQISGNTWEHTLKGRYCTSSGSGWDFEISKSSNSPEVFVKQEADTSLPCVGASEKPTPTPPPEPITGESQDLGCTLTADLGAWVQNSNGNISPVIKYSSQSSGLRADGGIISGCNWYGDLVYVGGDGGSGPPTVGPFPPDVPWPPEGPGVPDWLQDFISGFASEAAYNLINDWLESPIGPVTYELRSICEVNAQGEPETIVAESFVPALKNIDAVVARIDALIPLLQAQKDFKQPVCPPVKAEGELRTIGFISEETSPNGKSALRKRVRYRSVSGLGLDSLIDYWKDFRFDAGPVIVKHLGSSWGTVTVWASSIAEGKRVIRHAAGEAGVDADQTGRWEISSSTSTRLGMPGTMKVNQSGGYYWITARDGSDNRPLVGKT